MRPVELKPRAEQKIRALIAKGVSIPNPLSLDIGDEVNIDNISGMLRHIRYMRYIRILFST